MKRDWAFAPDSTPEQITEILQKHAWVIVKPPDRTQGEGVRKINSKEALKNIDDFIYEIKTNRLLLEECVEQHPLLHEVNPTSTNTLRISSVLDKEGVVHIFGASLRGGGEGSILDNLHCGGVQYPVDVEYGIITGGGVKFNGEKNILFHPGTNKKMIGLQIPHWNLVISTVEKAAKKLPSIRYVGWDVAVTENGCELIEGNSSQGCNGMQLDGKGKYKLVKRYL